MSEKSNMTDQFSLVERIQPTSAPVMGSPSCLSSARVPSPSMKTQPAGRSMLATFPRGALAGPLSTLNFESAPRAALNENAMRASQSILKQDILNMLGFYFTKAYEGRIAWELSTRKGIFSICTLCFGGFRPIFGRPAVRIRELAFSISRLVPESASRRLDQLDRNSVWLRQDNPASRNDPGSHERTCNLRRDRGVWRLDNGHPADVPGQPKCGRTEHP